MFKQRVSGLIVPKEKPAPPERQYSPLEIRDPERRVIAHEALLSLWDAMNLSQGCNCIYPGESRAAYDAHYHAYHYIGAMLLGKDCPEKEILT